MNLNFQKEISDSGIVIFELSGQILSNDDSSNIHKEVIECIEKEKLKIVFEMKELEYINSTGLNFIISSFTKLRNAGGELTICCISKKVEELLIITKLNTIFSTYETLEKALESFETKK